MIGVPVGPARMVRSTLAPDTWCARNTPVAFTVTRTVVAFASMYLVGSGEVQGWGRGHD